MNGNLRKDVWGWKSLTVGLVFPGSMPKIFSKPVGSDGGDRRRKLKEDMVTGSVCQKLVKRFLWVISKESGYIVA